MDRPLGPVARALPLCVVPSFLDAQHLPALLRQAGYVQRLPSAGVLIAGAGAQILNQGISWKLQDSKPDGLMEFEGYLEEKGPLGTAQNQKCNTPPPVVARGPRRGSAGRSPVWGEAGRPWEGSGWGYRTGLLPPGEGALAGAVAAWTRPRGLGGGVEEHRPNLGGACLLSG